MSEWIDFEGIIAERISYDYNQRRFSGRTWGPGVASEDIVAAKVPALCPRPSIKFYDDGPRHPDDCAECPTIGDLLDAGVATYSTGAGR